MTPAEEGAALAHSAPPLTDQQIEAAVRILGGVDSEQMAAWPATTKRPTRCLPATGWADLSSVTQPKE